MAKVRKMVMCITPEEFSKLRAMTRSLNVSWSKAKIVVEIDNILDKADLMALDIDDGMLIKEKQQDQNNPPK